MVVIILPRLSVKLPVGSLNYKACLIGVQPLRPWKDMRALSSSAQHLYEPLIAIFSCFVVFGFLLYVFFMYFGEARTAFQHEIIIQGLGSLFTSDGDSVAHTIFCIKRIPSKLADRFADLSIHNNLSGIYLIKNTVRLVIREDLSVVSR